MDIEELTVVKLFADLPTEEVERIAPMCSRTSVMPGTYLAKEGDFAYKFFALLAGQASVAHDQTEIAVLEAGDVFGEMALLDDVRRNANVIANSVCELATMMSWDFRDAVDANPQFAAAIDKITHDRAES